MSQAATLEAGTISRTQARRLFVASCMALTGSAMMFAVSGAVRGPWKEHFIFSNEQIGWIASAGAGFTLSMLFLGPLCDALGMGIILGFAFVTQIAGLVTIMSASGDNAFWMLFAGTLLHGIGGGAIEAACNPLIATIYPDSKTEKLNQFHMWFPGGIVIGGVMAYALDKTGWSWWQLKIGLVGLPAIAYGIMFIGQRYPATERVAAGVSFGGMFKETLLRPLFLVLLFCMMLTASLELGPNTWITPVLEAGGIPGILVLVWITGLMAVLRFFAGPVVKALGNSGVLLLSSIVGGVGLLMLSFSTNVVMAGISATIFGIGVCYFWPTMIGTAAERVPNGGAFALGLLGGLGGLFVNVVTTPAMGKISDVYVHRELNGQCAATAAVLEKVAASYPAWAANNAVDRKEINTAVEMAKAMLPQANAGQLPEVVKVGTEMISPANIFRAIIKAAPSAGDAKVKADAGLMAAATAGEEAGAMLRPADNHGGLMSFRYVAPMSLVLILIFGIMFIQDRQRARNVLPSVVPV
ncbi:MAG: MFS transporter [Planctomycetota bacterium]|nr:MFS transporter [Planctomycetota bacterium]